jgi:hypothetical protein
MSLCLLVVGMSNVRNVVGIEGTVCISMYCVQCPCYGHFTVRYTVFMIPSLYFEVCSVHVTVTLLRGTRCPCYCHFTVRCTVIMLVSLFCKVYSVHVSVTLL